MNGNRNHNLFSSKSFIFIISALSSNGNDVCKSANFNFVLQFQTLVYLPVFRKFDVEIGIFVSASRK